MAALPERRGDRLFGFESRDKGIKLRLADLRGRHKNRPKLVLRSVRRGEKNASVAEVDGPLNGRILELQCPRGFNLVEVTDEEGGLYVRDGTLVGKAHVLVFGLVKLT